MKFKCEICGRKLKAEESIAAGIGPECAARYQSGAAAAGSSSARLDSLASMEDADVTRWVRVAKLAIGRGRLSDAKAFIEAAEKAACPRSLAMAA